MRSLVAGSSARRSPCARSLCSPSSFSLRPSSVRFGIGRGASQRPSSVATIASMSAGSTQSSTITYPSRTHFSRSVASSELRPWRRTASSASGRSNQGRIFGRRFQLGALPRSTRVARSTRVRTRCSRARTSYGSMTGTRPPSDTLPASRATAAPSGWTDPNAPAVLRRPSPGRVRTPEELRSDPQSIDRPRASSLARHLDEDRRGAAPHAQEPAPRARGERAAEVRRRAHGTQLLEALPLPRRWFRRPDAALRVAGAHEAHKVAVGVFDNGVARPPEGVVRALLAAVAGGRQLLVQPVDLRTRGDTKANHDGRCAGRVRVRGGAMIRSAVFDFHTESPIEGSGRLHVAHDEVELVQDRPLVAHIVSFASPRCRASRADRRHKGAELP